MPTKQIRIDEDALAAFRAAVGVDLPDATAANAAVRTAATMPEREIAAMAYAMRWLLGLLADGHVVNGIDPALADRVSVTERGGEIHLQGDGHAVIRPSVTFRLGEGK